MTYKTILVHYDAGKYAAARLEIALPLADRFDAHVVGLYAESVTQSGSHSLGEGSQIVVEAMQRNARDRRKAAADAFTARVQRLGLARNEWRTSTADAADALALHARYADLLVIGQWTDDDPADHRKDLPARVLLGAGRPVLVVPYAREERPVGERVLVAWSATRESTRAVTDALGFLKAAKKVSVVAFNPRAGDAHGAQPGADIATWLARHGVKVEIAQQSVADLDVGNQLLSRAADMSADMIVMGAYGHSRLQELILGGVTRTLLDSMTVPVLMSH